MTHDVVGWCKDWGKTLGSKNDVRDLLNFNASCGKFDTLHFDELLLSIAHKASAKKRQKNYISWHWRMMQTLKKNWFFFLKNDMRNLVNFNAHFDGICTLMQYFCRIYVMFELKRYREVVSWKMIYGFKNDIRSLVNFYASSWK